jgi:DegV family protein with EDD domain
MIVLVTDSTAYFTQKEAKALGVVQVPMTYTYEGRTLYTEGYIDEDESTMLPTVAVGVNHYSTAQASLAEFLSTLEDILAEGNQAIVITISSRLSGTYANARKAAQELGPDRVAVVDSKTTAGALYLLLAKAREWIDAGLPLPDVVTKVKEAREKTRTFFSVEDMEPLRRSGRLGFVRLSVSTILNIRPILKLTSGGVNAYGMARGRQEQLRSLEDAVAKYQGPVVVQHCRADSMASQLTQRLRDKGIPVMERLLGPVLAIHLGSGCLSVAWIEG